ncbi:alkane hydroxylase MAH1-like [Vicia villosa]|uniref:alkane hydroxylase MAH1-like n=1 Tax=Vicia villosa TaxID=3911 RepID=UPI00273AFC6B|nr:alkane hydroxylase MAH1-like [Vicia villosa]
MMIYIYIYIYIYIFFIIFYNIWKRNKNVFIPNWPIIGMLPSVLLNLSDIHDFMTLGCKHCGNTFHFKGPWFTNMANIILTCDPMNVQYITSKNFSNYGKGSDFREMFEYFGVGIFNLESNEWKQERELLHSLLKRKSFEIFHQNNIQKKLEYCLLPFLEHAYKGVQVIDLQDIFERFTFDTACTFLFGFDPNSLPYDFNGFSDVSHVKAFSVLEDTILFRHCIPKYLWKLQKWLQIGQEKKNKVAQQNLHQFLYKCIDRCKGVEENRRLRRSDEDIDESDSCLLKEIIRQGLEKGEMFEKYYLRDTALDLLSAGSGTISSGLSWFFWLVSTHPIVEAKIVKEIKDNYLVQEENFIANLSMEELGKLVYLHGAICEALRLYPPVSFEHKCAIKADILPSGDHVSANTKVIYSLYAMGRMEQIWGDDCMEFKPERWISEKGQIIHVPSYKFIAFNAGPRSCIGKGISLIQMKMVAATMLWKFHIQVVESHAVTPRTSFKLRMKHGLKIKVTKRYIEY